MRTCSVALVHDWLESPGGGEAVLSSLLQIFPSAPVFTLVDFLSAEQRARLGHARIHTSFVQRMPGARRWFRYAAALVPTVIEGLDISQYDIIVSDSHAIAKGVRTRAGQIHICYCHAPARFAWTMASTYRERVASGHRWRDAVARRAQARFRAWDLAVSQRVDYFVANSRHTAQAIERCYGRLAPVIYPPVDVERFQDAGRGPRNDDYVTVSRLVPYKEVDLLVEAFRRLPQRRLTIIGDGPERRRLARSLPPNVTLAGRVDDTYITNAIGSARAFLFVAREDFGIAPVEAQAAGTPVIAYREGGASETIQGLDAAIPTGVLFDAQTVDAILRAIGQFESTTIDHDMCRINAARFSAPRFRAEFAAHFHSLLNTRPHVSATPN